jgi:hypothetical protein
MFTAKLGEDSPVRLPVQRVLSEGGDDGDDGRAKNNNAQHLVLLLFFLEY